MAVRELQYYTIQSNDDWIVISGAGQKSQSVICLHVSNVKVTPILITSRLNQLMFRDFRVDGSVEYTPPDDDLLLIQIAGSPVKTTLPMSGKTSDRAFYSIHYDVLMGQQIEIAPNPSVAVPLVNHGLSITFNARTEW